MSRIRTSRRTRNKRKKNKTKIIVAGIFLFALLFFSVIFSIMNMANDRIIKGVKIGTVDVSNLTRDEAKEKLNNWYKEIAEKDVIVTYKELEGTIITKELEEEPELDKLIKQATQIGKSGNIIKDNYDIFFASMFTKKIENKIKLKEDKIEEKIKELNSQLPNVMLESGYYIEDNKLIITKGEKGIKINKEKFINQLEETILKDENKKIEIPVKEVEPDKIDIEQIYNEIHKEVKNAEIMENPTKVIPEVYGVDFSISLEQIKENLEREEKEYIVDLKITQPEITLSQLGTKAFPELLAKYSTTYNSLNKNRETNLKLASEKVNETIILPGETFSYNKVVGQRTIANGYKEAAVYANGKVVDGIGGGICQLSSTLYNAAIYANLEITERTNHRFLTSYVTAGRDATVSWGSLDFCFKNIRTYPIKIISNVDMGVVTTEIYGIKEENEYEIAIESKIIEVLPYSINYVKDNTLEQGEEQIIQYGANGAKSQTYKIIKEKGIIISRELLTEDTYSPLERIVKKGAENTKNGKAENEIETLKEINPNLLQTLDKIKELD